MFIMSYSFLRSPVSSFISTTQMVQETTTPTSLSLHCSGRDANQWRKHLAIALPSQWACPPVTSFTNGYLRGCYRKKYSPVIRTLNWTSFTFLAPLNYKTSRCFGWKATSRMWLTIFCLLLVCTFMIDFKEMFPECFAGIQHSTQH